MKGLDFVVDVCTPRRLRDLSLRASRQETINGEEIVRMIHWINKNKTVLRAQDQDNIIALLLGYQSAVDDQQMESIADALSNLSSELLDQGEFQGADAALSLLQVVAHELPHRFLERPLATSAKVLVRSASRLQLIIIGLENGGNNGSSRALCGVLRRMSHSAERLAGIFSSDTKDQD